MTYFIRVFLEHLGMDVSTVQQIYSVVKVSCGQCDPIEFGFYRNAYFVIIHFQLYLRQITSLELVRNFMVIWLWPFYEPVGLLVSPNQFLVTHSPLGPLLQRLALQSILEGSFGKLLVTLGVCCSSWVVASRGSSKRSFLVPMGCTLYDTVVSANQMVARTPSCHW